MMSIFTSGNIKTKSDCFVSYTPKNSGSLEISIQSKTDILHSEKLNEIVQKTLSDLQIKHGKFEIVDNGGQYFVLMARIEATIKLEHPDLKLESLPEMKDHCKYASSRDRFRRSRLYLPGSQPKLMMNAGIHKPDAVILDLEDSVAPSEKMSARFIVRNALRTLDFFGAERMVRINQGEFGMQDIEALVPQNVHLILIPKVETAEELIKFDTKIAEVMNDCGRTEPVFIMPILESALGILNALEIAQASKNNVALAIGLEDYTADIGTQRTNEGSESFFARSMLVNAARATGLQPIDTVFSDVNDEDGLRASVQEAKSLGFDGKGCIHPRQIQPINEEFAPSQSEVEKAKKIVLAFDDAQAKGFGVVSLGSKMIDPPVVKRAIHSVNLAIATGMLEENWKEEGN
ncbi:MAG: citrate lyase ACP [Candidatus Marinimicrobia bacterium]|nr:citrate lyase ACP [Candidatus Neomarinimicrobiota bacterium]